MFANDSPLEVQWAATQQDLSDACAVRAQAYGHHDPTMANRFGAAEPLDLAEGTAVLLCRDRRDGSCIGTARIQVSGSGSLALESGMRLPHWLASRQRAQISRLAVVQGAASMVKLMLMKASYQYCLATQVRWMVIGARSQALIRNYRMLGFRDVFEPGAWLPLGSGGGLPHQILAFDVEGAREAWQATRHRLFDFMTDPGGSDGLPVAANDGWARSQPMDLMA